MDDHFDGLNGQELAPTDAWRLILEATTDADARQTLLRGWQAQVRALGHCGSLQTWNQLPCRRKPRAGYTVCPTHGARAPQTIAKAERALAVARMPAIKVLLDIVDQWEEETCSTCGYPRHDADHRRVYLSAAKMILDRTGMGPRATLDVNAKKVDDSDALVPHMTVSEKVELRGLLDQVNAIKARVRERTEHRPEPVAALPPGTIEGTVVESSE